MTPPDAQNTPENGPATPPADSETSEAVSGAQRGAERTGLGGRLRALGAALDADPTDRPIPGVLAEMAAEADRLERGGAELGRILDRTLSDVLDLSGAHHLIDQDGDGDWGAVWDILGELVAKGKRAHTLEGDLAAQERATADLAGIAHVVHTVRTRGGVGELPGVRIERVEDGKTATERRLEEVRGQVERMRPLIRKLGMLPSTYTRAPAENGDRVADLLSQDAYRLSQEMGAALDGGTTPTVACPKCAGDGGIEEHGGLIVCDRCDGDGEVPGETTEGGR